MKNDIRIIPKQEIYTEGKSSLAGTCAIKIYNDGNITFSYQASELMKFDENKFFQICENKKNEIMLIPNNIEGYKVNKRKNKYCYLCNSKPIARYLSNRFKKELSKGIYLEFIVSKTNYKLDNNNCFKIKLKN